MFYLGEQVLSMLLSGFFMTSWVFMLSLRTGKKGRQTLPPDRHHPTDILALLMWIFICSVVGSIIGFVWRKKSRKAEANGTPRNAQKYRKPIIAAAILMGLVIVAAEVRNAMRKSFRKTNYALLMAAKKQDIEAVKTYLDDGAENKRNGPCKWEKIRTVVWRV